MSQKGRPPTNPTRKEKKQLMTEMHSSSQNLGTGHSQVTEVEVESSVDMTTSRPGILQYLMPASSLLMILALSGGIYGLIAPCAWASAAFGIHSSSSPSSAESAYASFAAARNLGSGVTLAGLIALGNRQAVGVFLMSGAVTGLADSWICSSFGGEMASRHAVMAFLIAGWGLGVLLSG